MKKYIALLSTVLALSACSLPHSGRPLETWQNYIPASVSTEDLATNQGLVVFYRGSDVQGPAVNVYVNGDYQTSLLENGFSPIILCADRNLMTSSFSSNSKGGNRTQGVKFVTPSRQVTYIKIKKARNDGSPMFERVEPEVGFEEVKLLQMQSQTISRVLPSACNQNEYVLDAKLLNANATFPLNKHSYNDVLPEGKRNVQEFAAKIKGITRQAISKIEVNGYTDPVGSDSYNQKLSERRAHAIREVLMNAGVTVPTTAVGYGERDLVVPNCEAEHGKNVAAKTACNLPNRRVEIVVYGSESN
ncbi:OmpA family protein [Testudinibacter sp. P80/BLE/0925]|uniref:OmpA family protein n=1 Tax=Testudinibacter sp. TW-1 TaxID=3417757 RepID=UPI003D368CEB